MKEGMYFLCFLILGSLTHVKSATISPYVQKNVLRFPYGVNFKFNGMLHQNMARVWIVTKFPIPRYEDLELQERNFMPECDFEVHSDDVQAWTDEYHYVTGWMHHICMSVQPQLKLLQEKEKFYKRELQQLLDEEILTALPALGPAGRTKRFAAALIPAIAGLVTLAVESLSGYLQNKRNKYIALAVDALSKENGHYRNQFNRYGHDLLLYGEFSVNSTEGIIDTLNEMYSRQTLVEETVANLTKDWPAKYLSNPAGAALYASHVATYLSTVTEKYLALLRDLLHDLENLVLAVKTLSEGKLPIQLIPPQMLQKFTSDVEKELAIKFPDYTLAFPHISYYYDMELVTFGIDEKHSLVITFPLFIKPRHTEPFVLYEIETVDVPVEDMNPSLNSFTRVQVTKPYLAANAHHYIQLQIQELNMCKVIQKDYFCEELFMVKHATLHTCESSLFYDRDKSVIDTVCNFEFFLNKSVIPSVLDRGESMVLANLSPDKNLNCIKQIQNKLPGNSYMLTNRSLLCHCSVQNGLSFIPQDIGSCNNETVLPTFHYTTNLAFMGAYQVMRQLGENTSSSFPQANVSEHIAQTTPKPFPVDLNDTSVQEKIEKLQHWKSAHKKVMKTSAHVSMSNVTSLMENYFTDVTYMTVTQGRLSVLFLLLTILAQIAYMAWLTVKVHRLGTLVATLTFQSIPLCKAQTMNDQSTKVVCHNVWLSILFTTITIIGIMIWLSKNLRNGNCLKGYKFNRTLDVDLIICDNLRYVPVKIRVISGHFYKLHLIQTDVIGESQLKLKRNFLWDTLTIDWKDIQLKYAGETVSLPTSIVIPLGDEFRLRSLTDLPFDSFLMVKQGTEWKDLRHDILLDKPDCNNLV